MNRKLLVVVASLALAGCSPAAIATTTDTIRTVNDAARIACEAAFGAEELPHGLTVEDLCRVQEDLQPFVDAILGAKQAVGAKHGVAAEE